MNFGSTKISTLFEKRKLFLLIFFFFCYSYTQSQTFFELKFGTPMDDRVRGMQQLSDGSIYLAGFSNAGPNGGYDIALAKVSPTGVVQWTKYYGKQVNEYALFINKTQDDHLILCGETHQTATGIDAWIMKIDSLGDVIWSSGISSNVNESFKYVEETSDGGFIMGGFQSDSSSSNDIFIVKTDSQGNFQWQKAFGGTDNDYADAIKQTSDGGYIISADTKSWGLPDYQIYMIKIDSIGNFLWDNLSGGPFADGCQGFITTSDQSYFTFGESIVNWSLPYDFFLQLTDSTGMVQWQKNYGGLGSDAGFSAVETPDSGFVITGYSNSHDPSTPIDLVLFKVDKNGDSLWTRYYGGSGIDIGYYITSCIGGGYLVAGTTWLNDNDFYLIKIDENGIVDVQENLSGNSSLLLYPNPGKIFFNLESDHILKNPRFTIQDLFGRVLLSEIMMGDISKINIDHSLENGTYILSVETASGISRQKFLVE